MPIAEAERRRQETVIRDMERTDADRVGEVLFRAFNAVAERHGYPPKLLSTREAAAWAGTIARHGPHVFVVAERENRIAGVCCLHPRGDSGGIGPVAVDPAFQGRGIGKAMVQAVLDRAPGLASVRLYQEAYNAASFALYYALGFQPVADLVDMTAVPEAGSSGPADEIGEASKDDLEACLNYDGPRSRYDRRPDLAFFLHWGKVFVSRKNGRIGGLLACLPGPASVQFGPLVADGEREAHRLFRHARAVYGNRSCQTRVFARDRSLVAMLRGLGFRISCLDLLMVRGAWRPGRSVEAFGRFPEGA